ncbi:N-acetylmuramoyl-L-alanine amidase [Chroococcidiopsis sp.]|uniref:N-acetylmuramoyl-L-alanine amidase n=1 Tax=Chroococcidiopsis sp. TaxID=3088168 RepID=UPI003F38F8E1
MVRPVGAEQQLSVVYPPANHQTVADRIFLVGTAPPTGKVLVNGKPIERSRAGHFAPSFPLRVGDNTFTLQYQDRQVQLKVQRQDTTPAPPIGLAFGKDSLTPNVDIARMPGELVCFSAIAPPQSVVSVQLGKDNIRLLPQLQQAQLPANSALLTGRNQPTRQLTSGQYQGCTTLPELGNLPYENNVMTSGFTPGSGIQPQFQLTLNGQTVTQLSPGKVTILSPANLEVVEVTANEGVARTGASTDYSRLTPLPKGTRATVTGKEGEWLRLDYGGWINSQETRIIPGAIPPRSLIRSVSAHRVPGATEIVLPLQVPVPVSIQQGDRTLTLTLHNTTAQTDTIRFDDDPIISRLDWQQVTPDRLEYIFNLKSQQQWGYKLRYEGTSLVLTLRHQPRNREQVKSQKSRVKIQNSELKISDSRLPNASSHNGGNPRKRLAPPDSPLSGIKILLDPGHGGKESGALGSTGYPEKEINLLMSKLVREQLARRGAEVYLTREDDRDLSLPDRVAIIDKIEPAIAISLHYNALPDAGNAMKTQGLAAFWYHPQAHDLASFLHSYLVQKLNRPDYGLYWNNLALTRPASAPTILLELGFMINPYEFEWIVNPQAQQQLASAIAQGITQWFSNIR